MGEKIKKIKFGYFAIAAVFLWNPMMGTIDVLPDFIGYLLICSALTGLSEINDHFAEALSGFRKLVYVSLLKFALSSFIVFKNYSSEDTFTLLYLFVCAVLTVVFAMSALTALKKGFQYLPMYAKSKVIDKPLFKGAKATKNDFVYAVTMIFMFAHSIITVFPEFFSLFKKDEYGNVNYDMLTAHSFLRGIAFYTVLALGIIWLVTVSTYFVKVRGDREFVSAISARYNERIYANESTVIRRSIKKGLGFLSISFVFALDVFVDGLNVLPSFLGAIFMIMALVSLKKYITGYKSKMALSVIALASGLAKWIIENSFNSKYSYLQIEYYDKVRDLYITLSAVNLADTVIQLLLVISAVAALKEIIEHHTGFSVKSGKEFYTDPKIVELHGEINKKTVPIYVFAAIKSATAVFYYIAQPFTEWYFELAFTYHIIACALFIIFAYSLVKKVNDEVSYKYMLA